jgi:HEAT repeat protein
MRLTLLKETAMPISERPDIAELMKKRDVKGLIAVLSCKDERGRRDAMNALVQIGLPSVDPLLSELKRLSREVYQAAVEVLVRIGSPAVEPLSAALQSKDTYMRKAAIQALGRIGDTRAVEPLIPLLEGTFWKQRIAAAGALGQIGDTQAVEPLIMMLEDKKAAPGFPDGYPQARSAAARALGQIGDARAVEPLIVTLQSDWPSVRVVAAEALGQIGDSRAIDPLSGLIVESGDGELQRSCIHALVKVYQSEQLDEKSRQKILSMNEVKLLLTRQ